MFRRSYRRRSLQRHHGRLTRRCLPGHPRRAAVRHGHGRVRARARPARTAGRHAGGGCLPLGPFLSLETSRATAGWAASAALRLVVRACGGPGQRKADLPSHATKPYSPVPPGRWFCGPNGCAAGRRSLLDTTNKAAVDVRTAVVLHFCAALSPLFSSALAGCGRQSGPLQTGQPRVSAARPVPAVPEGPGACYLRYALIDRLRSSIRLTLILPFRLATSSPCSLLTTRRGTRCRVRRDAPSGNDARDSLRIT